MKITTKQPKKHIFLKKLKLYTKNEKSYIALHINKYNGFAMQKVKAT